MVNNDNIQPVADDSQIVLYQPDESIRLEVKLDQDTVWLTQAQMTEFFVQLVIILLCIFVTSLRKMS